MTRPSPRLTAHDPDDAAFRVVEVVDIADADTLTSFVLDPGHTPWPAFPPPHQPGTAPPAGAGGSPTPGRSRPVPAGGTDATWTGDRADVARRHDGALPARGRGLGGAPRARRRPGRHAIDAHVSRQYRVTHGEVAVLAAVAGIVVCLIGVLIALSWQRARAADRPGLRLPSAGSAPASASQPAGPLELAGTLGGVGVPSAHLAPTAPAPHGARTDGATPAPGPGGLGPSGTDPEAVLAADRAAARPGDPRENPAPTARATQPPPPPEPATEPAPAAEAPNAGPAGGSPPSPVPPPAANSPQAATSPAPAASPVAATSPAAARSPASASSPATGVTPAPATSPAAAARPSTTRPPARSAPPASRAAPTRAPTPSTGTPTSTGTAA